MDSRLRVTTGQLFEATCALACGDSKVANPLRLTITQKVRSSVDEVIE